MWDLSDYNSPERSGKYNNSRQYRMETCNYVLGYTAPLDELLDLPLRLSLQAKYSQYPHRRVVKKLKNGNVRHHHVKGEQLAMFIRFNNILPDSTRFAFRPTVEIDYQSLSYYWLIKFHNDLSYPINERIRAGVNGTLYTKPSRAYYASTGHTGYTITSMYMTPYVRYKLRDNVSLRLYVGFSAALEHFTRDIWRRSALNNRRNHWCGTSITWTF